jgi:hypothetical protein
MGVFVKEVGFPFEVIPAHFRVEDLQSAILSLLLIIPLAYGELADRRFIHSLVKRAVQKDKRAFMALMRLSEDETIADILTRECTWMGDRQFKLENRLCLFFRVFRHERLRPALADSPEILSLLGELVGTKTIMHLKDVCVIVRRLGKTHDNWQLAIDLSREGILAEFFSAARSIDPTFTDHVWLAVLLISQTLAERTYVKELLIACTVVQNVIETDSDMIGAALALAVTLGQHELCRRKLAELGLRKSAERLYRRAETRKVAGKVLMMFEGKRGD